MEDRFAVLVIDDDVDIRETLRDIIEGEGLSAAGAANGAEALAMLAKAPRPSLIVLDLMMPVMSGWDFLVALRALPAFADVPVAVISASGGAAAPREATCFLRKPIDLDAFLDVVRKYGGASSRRAPETRASMDTHA